MGADSTLDLNPTLPGRVKVRVRVIRVRGRGRCSGSVRVRVRVRVRVTWPRGPSAGSLLPPAAAQRRVQGLELALPAGTRVRVGVSVRVRVRVRVRVGSS